MQYYFCPRCKFKTVAVKKHLCLTCGYKLPKTHAITDGATSNTTSTQSGHQLISSRLWSKLFKWEFNPGYDNKKDTDENTAEPAIS